MIRHIKYGQEIRISTDNTTPSLRGIIVVLNNANEEDYLKLKKEIETQKKPNSLTKIVNRELVKRKL